MCPCSSATSSARRARAERLDPEDVRALLSGYHEHVRAELERFGGTVEKFIGDAVMALFGAPVVREDDPERAVRAALAIRERAGEEGDLQVRVGITTARRWSSLGAWPEAGEAMASGDVVNTAARLQAAAPVNGILVDETTYRATQRSIDYGERREAGRRRGRRSRSLSGRCFRRGRASRSNVRPRRAPLVGREQEREVLLGAPSSARAKMSRSSSRSSASPGIGKSRLVYELFKRDRKRRRAHLLAPGSLAAVRRGSELSGRSPRS